MRPIAKSVKRQVRSTESSHIVSTTIRLSHNAVRRRMSLSLSYLGNEKLVKRKALASSGWLIIILSDTVIMGGKP